MRPSGTVQLVQMKNPLLHGFQPPDLHPYVITYDTGVKTI